MKPDMSKDEIKELDKTLQDWQRMMEARVTRLETITENHDKNINAIGDINQRITAMETRQAEHERHTSEHRANQQIAMQKMEERLANAIDKLTGYLIDHISKTDKLINERKRS